MKNWRNYTVGDINMLQIGDQDFRSIPDKTNKLEIADSTSLLLWNESWLFPLFDADMQVAVNMHQLNDSRIENQGQQKQNQKRNIFLFSYH